MFPYKLNFFFSSTLKNAIGNLIWIALSLQIALGSIIIFMILIIPVQEHHISFHLFLSSLISFIREMQIKTTMRCHLKPVRMAIIKKSTNNKCQRRYGERELSHTVGGNIN